MGGKYHFDIQHEIKRRVKVRDHVYTSFYIVMSILIKSIDKNTNAINTLKLAHLTHPVACATIIKL